MTWGTLLEDWEDGEAEKIVEEEFYHLLRDLPPCQHILHGEHIWNQLQGQKRRVATPQVAVPHRTVRAAGRHYNNQGTVTVPSYYANQSAPFAVSILSLDTAVSTETGNLAEGSPSWSHIEHLFRSGWVPFALAGSPCETFSEARHQLPVDEDPNKWPRPLRSAAELWGLAGLRAKELRQVQIGSQLHLQTLYLLMLVWRHGSAFVSEHPAIPQDAEKASTWTSPIMMAMRQLDGVHFNHIQQYHWGASSVKPTGFLHSWADGFLAWDGSLEDSRCPTAQDGGHWER